jgi:hypothetical protein
VPVPGRPGTVKIYPIEALQRLAKGSQATRELKASEPFPPPGFVTRQQSCGIIGIKLRTLWADAADGCRSRSISGVVNAGFIRSMS